MSSVAELPFKRHKFIAALAIRVIYDFLLLANSDHVHTLYRFPETSGHLSKIAIFDISSYLMPPANVRISV